MSFNLNTGNTEAKLPINIILDATTMPYKTSYYCIKCRGYLLSTNKDITTLWMGEGYPEKEIPNGMGWIQVPCRGQNCKRTYNLYLQ